jgi:hypothetical protein
MLKGLPDFSQIIKGENFIAFAPFQDGREVTVMPTVLGIAQTATDSPAFTLEFVRDSNPFATGGTHGFLYMRLEVGDLTEAMINKTRETWQQKPLTKPHFYQGFIRLMLQTNSFDTEALKTELAEVTSLDGVPVSRIQFIRKVSEPAAAMLKKALTEKSLLLDAYAELELKGITPRLPLSIEFNPEEFVKFIEKIADTKGNITINALMDYLKANKERLPIKYIKKDTTISTEDFIMTLIDWIIGRFYAFVPAPTTKLEPHIKLKEKVSSGKFIWDFSEPLLTSRIFPFSFDAISLARKLVETNGLNSILKETTIQNLNTGFLRLAIRHYFRTLPENVLKIGVKIIAPANAQRSQTLTETVYVDVKKDTSIVELKFSPREEKVYTYQTLVVIKDSNGSRELKGVVITSKEPIIRLGYGDFPIQFMPIEAGMGLLKSANIKGRWAWKENSTPRSVDFELTDKKQEYLIAVPKDGVTELSGSIKANDKASMQSLELKLESVDNVYLDRYSFPEYGTHTVTIKCILSTDQPIYVLEILPEHKTDVPGNITTLAFTPTQTERTWTWFTDSIFQAGFRYRKNDNGKVAEWSSIQSPFVGVLAIGSTNNNQQIMEGVPKINGDTDFEGTRYFKSADDAESYLFIPLNMGAAKNSQGDLSLSFMIFGGKGIFQVSIEWSADTQIVEEIKRKIARQKNVTPDSLRLNFAPMVIDRADLILIKDKKATILESSKTSGFPPYNAIFNANLDKDQQNLVIAALHQRKDTLQVRYYATRAIFAKVLIRIEGNISTAKRKLTKNATFIDCKDWILDAIDDNLLKKTVQIDELTDQSLQESTEQEAIDKAANDVLLFVKDEAQLTNAALLVEVEKGNDVEIPFVMTTDIASWFKGNEADEYIKIFN